MHKFLLPAALLLAAGTAQAQIPAGTILVGGNINYSRRENQSELTPTSGKRTTQTVTGFDLGPTAGYFLADNLMLGLGLDYQKNHATAPVYVASLTGDISKLMDLEAKSRYLAVGPVVRYYHFLGENAAFYGQAGAGYRTGKAEDEYLLSANPNAMGTETRRTESSGFYGQLSPGFVYFPVSKLGLEVSLRGLSFDKMSSESTSTTGAKSPKASSSLFDAGIGLNDLRFGAAFYFGR
ncbi:outer membrane beta-barrel protein [Hymenobacter busanensis]|uniref:Outer membrane beta-barrel protein n=1 Tax=Hymenobacter busanensis TaxID=2607656 RepID=A0A7L4ZZR8_9BACT|nr:outer membrane beta-barrel protein [Hymenobacter busanensis]KAA9331282.1 outer membrane beta-barrel protein [Hymenobacter busanensis]QHJ08433.1 outer membrane beta-barrel protein [Hymenobacter busanensis]